MRHVNQVINAIWHTIPEAERPNYKLLQKELEAISTDAAYKSPEQMPPLFGRVSRALELHLGETDTKWKKDIQAIFADRDKPFRYRDFIGEKNAEKMHNALDDLLDSENPGFIIIADMAKKKINDTYWNVCNQCVLDAVQYAAEHGVESGQLVQEAVAKMAGHTHSAPPAP